MSVIYRGVYISQHGDYILSIMLALSTVQFRSEIWYPYANVFFQRNVLPVEHDFIIDKGQCHYVFIFSCLSQLSNVTKTQATFWSEVHFKPMTNLKLSNALAHDAKLVLSFITQRKCRDPRDPLRSLITLRAPPPMSFIA